MDARTELITKIDSLVQHGIYCYGRKAKTAHSSYFVGYLDAYLDFAYTVADGDSVQDAIDLLIECGKQQTEDVMADKGYAKGASTIIETVKRFAGTYTQSCEYPIKHVLSTIYVELFDMFQ